MNVQWMLLAQRFQFRPDSSLLDIAGIFERVTVNGPPYVVQFAVLAKINYGPIEAGTDTEFVVRVGKPESGDWSATSLPYSYPRLDQWIEGATPYVGIRYDLEFAETGMHSVQLIHDGKMVAEQSFTIRDLKEIDNA